MVARCAMSWPPRHQQMTLTSFLRQALSQIGRQESRFQRAASQVSTRMYFDGIQVSRR